MNKVRAMAAHGPRQAFEPFEYETGPLKPDEVDIDVEFCGLCHSDMSVWLNEWGNSVYPFVGGHEVVGRVRVLGADVPGLKAGDRVGLGWYSRSNLSAALALGGDHNLCEGNEQTIVGRHGGFANSVRCQWPWAVPLPDDLTVEAAGPLFCGGITVFNPIVQFGVQPTDRVAVVGIGGLGHFALQFLNKWGCEVTAFTSSPDKAAEAKRFGAHHTADSRDPGSWSALRRRFDFILSTVAVDLPWDKLIDTLAPRGRLHLVGVAPSAVPIHVFQLIAEQRSFSSSPLGAPATTLKMLEFCARHGIEAQTERFGLSDLNAAMAHLESGKARYRVVLENDL